MMVNPQILTLAPLSSFLKKRPSDAHKGSHGHVLILGGDFGFPGAPKMAAVAALRVGAGLVTVGTRKVHALILPMTFPEIMAHEINATKTLQLLINRATVIIVGPGLGQSTWGKKLLLGALKSKKPLVVDADALNLIAKKPISRNDWILTPHPGEAARLLGISIDAIQADRFLAAQKIQKKFGGVIVLKGAGTLIVSSDETPSICHAGNPGMATAGMGDLLSGVIGGLLAQGIPLLPAAKLGVLIHACAGDEAAKAGERGLIASDLLPFLRKQVNP